MDKRLKEISTRLSEYSAGKFDKNILLSPRLDEVDAIINGINMLGEELKAVTISRDYFTNIFNSVSDMVFILNNKGVIADANTSAEAQLQYEAGELIGKPINELHRGTGSFLRSIVRELKKGNGLIAESSVLYSSEGAAIPVSISATYFKEVHQQQPVILLTACDITYQKKAENLVIRAIIDTQETERRRLAKDLHDSLTQQLSAIKFYIASIVKSVKSPREKYILLKSNDALTTVISDMRNICFNLMPKTLEEFGLLQAVKEFCNHFLYQKKANFIIEQTSSLPELSRELAVDLYRVVQEFITNAINHGSANKISIRFSYLNGILKILLEDNGKGFNIHQSGGGMGLQKVQSRIKSHKGALNMISTIGKGTCFKISIPLTKQV
ncbi:MAG: hypothetical protein JWR61_2246 [Ferruginibacter sp.]|uniref:PAS domain-containing sensor histidine kinase n=1 Tax=Ferruginibacter sp. TaxID=1940288 RepID=UPI00265830BC|nr:ATP-binding protein [Ferruginibacter sp.]MDB5277291.1 hypothetical protein [Ferruginibacter sp.]